MHGLADATLEGFGRPPAEFAFDLAGVNGITAIMARPIRDVGDLGLVRQSIGPRLQFVEHGTQGQHDIQIPLLVPAADVISLADLAGFEDAAERAAVILDKKPVADLPAVAIDGQRLAGQGMVNDQRNKLFREMERTVIVGTMGGQDRQAVRVAIGSNQVIACRLACRIGAVRCVAAGFGEGRITLAE